MVVGLISEDGSMDGNDLRDYAQSNLEKVLARVPGVGEVEEFGTQYAMRIWLNPDKLTDYSLTVDDVVAALQAYNVEVSAGQFGGAPAVQGPAPERLHHRPEPAEDSRGVRRHPHPHQSGRLHRADQGRGTDGAGNRSATTSRRFYNGKPAAAMAIRQIAGANALDTANAVKAKLKEMSRYFPPGMKVVYPYDTTPFVKVAIEEVVKTLFEAILLVFLIMWLFMGNIRATLIPTIAVPVVLLGTFAVLGLFGFSINMLTMFAMVLAIGLLVDDAIVVVENVERIMSEEGLSPQEATAKSMEQITSALIGIGLGALGGVRSHGLLRRLHRRHLPPVFRDHHRLHAAVGGGGPDPDAGALRLPAQAGGKRGMSRRRTRSFSCRPFFRWFDRIFFRTRDRYVRTGRALLFTGNCATVIVYLLIVAAVGFLFLRMPTAYLPDEDQGILLSR